MNVEQLTFSSSLLSSRFQWGEYWQASGAMFTAQCSHLA